MTIEQLIECDASTLEKMTDAELLEHFKQYLPITRPEQAPKKQTQQKQFLAANPKLAQAAVIGKSIGINIDLSLLQGIKKRK